MEKEKDAKEVPVDSKGETDTTADDNKVGIKRKKMMSRRRR
jgi:hypothetical protein